MKRAARRSNQRNPMLWVLSVIIVASMVCSLAISVLPSRSAPAEETTATPRVLWTPSPVPPQPTAAPTAEPTAPVAAATSVPPEESGGPWTFAVLGASQGAAAAARAALQAILQEGDVFVLHTGDMTATGTQVAFEEWRELLAEYPVPFYPTPGEQDNADGHLVAYLAFSGAPATHYSFDRGPLHVAVVNASEGALGDEELAWLAADLAGTSAGLRVVALHYPPFAAAEGAEVLASGGEAFQQLMTSEGVDLVVAGHLPASSDEVRDGVRYVTPGALDVPSAEGAPPQYLRVTVEETGLAVEGVPVLLPAE